MRFVKMLAGGLAVVVLVLGAPRSASAVAIGLTDTFEDLSTMNWITAALGQPNPAPPANAAGGPGGAADHYLLLTAIGGASAGSRLSAINETQWAGDYLAAGIASLTMDVNNFGQTDLFLRLVFEDFPAGPPPNVAFSTSAIKVPAGSGWTQIAFPILPAALTLAGSGTVGDVLSSTDVIRIYHNELPNFPNPVFPIDPVNALVGVDNITAQAAAVPEPGLLLLVGTSLAAALARRRVRAIRNRFAA